MSLQSNQLEKLGTVINESLRIQRGGAEPIAYIDVSHALSAICARQNHVVFARRGCGKTLLLHQSANKLPDEIQTVYLNCEDFKHHSFPNVLIEILDTLFGELERNLSGWFGKKKKSRDLIKKIRTELKELRQQEDDISTDIVEKHATENNNGRKIENSNELDGFKLAFSANSGSSASSEVELRYAQKSNKLTDLQDRLPEFKRDVREFFEISKSVKSIFLQVDDFYHLSRGDQPDVMDYLHRLCKDLPLYFKVATLRHSSRLYVDHAGQPIGAQERHDYQPINIDFAFTDFKKTASQNLKILYEFAKRAGLSADEINSLFKGEGFNRLVMAGGGVPRDVLSLFLEVLQDTTLREGDDKIGKDDVRLMSLTNFERRIEELKQDSAGEEQSTLIRGIYVLQKFCIDRKTNIMMVSEETIQQEDQIRALLYRLLDYRIIHTAAIALTHKSSPGTYRAFAIDIGCYAFMRKLQGRFNEINVSDPNGKEKMRSAPILDKEQLKKLWSNAPPNPEQAIRDASTEVI